MAAISKYYLINTNSEGKIFGICDTIEQAVKAFENSPSHTIIMTPVSWRVTVEDVTNASNNKIEDSGARDGQDS